MMPIRLSAVGRLQQLRQQANRGHDIERTGRRQVAQVCAGMQRRVNVGHVRRAIRRPGGQAVEQARKINTAMPGNPRVASELLGGDAHGQRFTVQIHEMNFEKARQQLRQVQIVAVAGTQDA